MTFNIQSLCVIAASLSYTEICFGIKTHGPGVSSGVEVPKR